MLYSRMFNTNILTLIDLTITFFKTNIFEHYYFNTNIFNTNILTRIFLTLIFFNIMIFFKENLGFLNFCFRVKNVVFTCSAYTRVKQLVIPVYLTVPDFPI